MTLQKLIENEGTSDFASRVGIDPSTAYRIREGKRSVSIETAAKIKKVYGLKLEDIRPDLFDCEGEFELEEQ